MEKFQCRICGCHFSRSTFSDFYCQKVRRINGPLREMLCSGVSQRRSAKLLGVDRKTVERRFRFLAEQARKRHFKDLQRYRAEPLEEVQFDDLETSIHTKCKPASVALAVDPKHRKILNFQASQMPPKGPLAKTAYKKYGFREDHRPEGWDRLLQGLIPIVKPAVIFMSDKNPHYPKFVTSHHPSAVHKTTPGGRGAIVGQGELKKLVFDPLFSLNHTCAMLRANMNRLFRRTWCTSKKMEGLISHLWLYVDYHNSELTTQLAQF